jgi:hypothetical protein
MPSAAQFGTAKMQSHRTHSANTVHPDQHVHHKITDLGEKEAFSGGNISRVDHFGAR